MTRPDTDPFDLEAAFDHARRQPPQMSRDLRARITQDAQALMAQPSVWQRIVAAVGGPAGVGGLVTAAAAGFWLGIAPPSEALDPLAMLVAQEDDMADLFGFGWTAEEGS